MGFYEFEASLVYRTSSRAAKCLLHREALSHPLPKSHSNLFSVTLYSVQDNLCK